MSRTERLAIAGILLVVAAAAACGKSERAPKAVSPSPAATPAPKILYWYDPMKPEVRFDHPGKSPFMDMELVPKYAEAEAAEPPKPAGDMAVPPGYSKVTIPLERRQEIGVTTVKVERRPIGGALQTNGIVAEDEARVQAVNAKFAGYIEKLYVDRTGQSVRRGERLLTVYSPDLVSTERELLLAAENARRLEGSSSASASSDAQSLLAATRQRLRLWDISPSEIDRIEKTGEVSRTLTLSSPASGVVLKKDAVAGMAISPGMPLFTIADLSVVWVLADVYQSEIAGAAKGEEAEISSSVRGESFRGRVDFVYPTFSPETRTGKVRIVVPSPKGSLEPGMFVRVSIRRTPREALTVPRSAIIETGERQIAFVEQSPGVYVPRAVKVGSAEGDFVEVVSGLSSGEVVVSSANFLIDSESRIGGVGTAPAGSAGQPAQSIVPTPAGPR